MEKEGHGYYYFYSVSMWIGNISRCGFQLKKGWDIQPCCITTQQFTNSNKDNLHTENKYIIPLASGKEAWCEEFQK